MSSHFAQKKLNNTFKVVAADIAVGMFVGWKPPLGV